VSTLIKTNPKTKYHCGPH